MSDLYIYGNDIRVGSKVRLKSGSPDLTVCWICSKNLRFEPEDEVIVWWYDDDNKMQAGVYRRDCLTLILVGLSEEEMEKKGLKFVPCSEIK